MYKPKKNELDALKAIDSIRDKDWMKICIARLDSMLSIPDSRSNPVDSFLVKGERYIAEVGKGTWKKEEVEEPDITPIKPTATEEPA